MERRAIRLPIKTIETLLSEGLRARGRCAHKTEKLNCGKLALFGDGMYPWLGN